MSDIEVKLTVPSDDEGYIKMQCPYCHNYFKIRANEYDNKEKPIEELHCPYCSLIKQKQSFLTRELMEHGKALLENKIKEIINKEMRKACKNNSVDGLKMTYTPYEENYVPELTDKEEGEYKVKCKYCECSYKIYDLAENTITNCPYCGGLN